MAIAETGSKASSGLIRTSVPNLISGVSQQADTFKLASQATEQINAISSVVSGLAKRSGTAFLKALNFSGLTPIKFFKIARSLSEQYLAVLLNNNSTNVKSLKIFALDGTEQTVYEYEAGVSLTNYFNNATSSSVKSLTIADYTFLVNSNKTVSTLNDTTSRALAGNTQVYQGMIVVKQGYTGKSTQSPSGLITYSVKIVDKTTGAVYATSTSNSDNFSDASPNAIASSIVSNLSLTINTQFSIGNYRIFASGSNVYIQHESIDFDIVADDGYAGTLFYGIKNEVQNFTDLPVFAPHLFVTKIAGFPEEVGDEYYVRHISSQPDTYSQGTSSSVPKGIRGISAGYWEECVAPTVTYKLDTASMPHTLVKIGDGKFLFTPVNGDSSKSYGGVAYTSSKSWGNRNAGDVESNPWPSFVGNKIENAFFYKNRLGLLSGESVIFSEAGEFFNFFRTTMPQLLDSEPIDISSSTQEVGTLYHAIPFYDRVVLFGEKMQFSIQADGELTAKSVSLQQTTAFDVNKEAPPIAIGNKIYFSFNRAGGYSGITEYFINPNTILLDGLDISSNIPSYINGSTISLVGSEIDNILLTLQNSSKNEIGVYKFFYSGEEKIQSSWSKFDFGTGKEVLNAFIVSGKIYLVILRNSFYNFEVLDLNETGATTGTGGSLPSNAGVFEPFKIHLDNFVTPTLGNGFTTSVVNGITTAFRSVTFPAGYDSSQYASMVLIFGDGTSYAIVNNNGTLSISTTKFVNNNPVWQSLQAETFKMAGFPFTMKYTLSRPIIRSTSGRGQSSVLDGRLQIRNGILNFSDSLFFQIKVTPKYKDTYTYTYLYKMVTNYLGVSSTNLDYINFKDGSFRFPVFSDAEELQVVIENPTPYGCFLLSLEWEALYSARSKRIG
jgi:hypothetical protein